jgi:hypothetical protein
MLAAFHGRKRHVGRWPRNVEPRAAVISFVLVGGKSVSHVLGEQVRWRPYDVGLLQPLQAR